MKCSTVVIVYYYILSIFFTIKYELTKSSILFLENETISKQHIP